MRAIVETRSQRNYTKPSIYVRLKTLIEEATFTVLLFILSAYFEYVIRL